MTNSELLHELETLRDKCLQEDYDAKQAKAVGLIMDAIDALYEGRADAKL